MLPGHARIYADSVYQGYDKNHSNLDIPYKDAELIAACEAAGRRGGHGDGCHDGGYHHRPA